MGRTAITVLYVVLLVTAIVAVDVLFFRHHLAERLAANVGIALLFAAFYFRFMKQA